VRHSHSHVRLVKCFGFYRAANRKDSALIEKIHERVSGLAEGEWEEGKIPNPESFLGGCVVPGKSTTEDELDEMYGAIKSKGELEIDRARLREGIELISSSADQVIDRLVYETVSEQWFAHLVLLSTLVKHTELIPDIDKRAHLAAALDGWVQFAANSLAIVNPLAKERRITLNGITYVSTLSDRLPIGEVARRLALSMPAASAKMATTFMGTEKLVPQLQDGIGTASEPPARQLMRLSILADLGAGDISGLAAKLTEVVKDKRFLSHALARKVSEVDVSFRLPKPLLAKRPMSGRADFSGLHSCCATSGGRPPTCLVLSFRASGVGPKPVAPDNPKGSEALVREQIALGTGG